MATPKAGVQVEGAAELRRALRKMGRDLRDLTAVNRAAAQPVYERAQELVPRLSGTLARTIKLRASKTRALVQAGRGSVPYAGPIHFGWPRHGIEAQPFLTDALSDRREQVVAVYSDKVAELVRRVDRETPG